MAQIKDPIGEYNRMFPQAPLLIGHDVWDLDGALRAAERALERGEPIPEAERARFRAPAAQPEDGLD